MARQRASIVRGVSVLALIGLLGALAVATPTSAHKGPDYGHVFRHLTQLRKNLKTAGTINAAKNPVDWTKLKNVPAGFADGTDADTDASAAYSTYRDAETTAVDLPGTGGVDNPANTIGSLSLPAGTYVLIAKLIIQSSAPSSSVFVDCGLFAGGSRDISAVTMTSSQLMMPLTFVANLPAGGTAEVRCSDFDGAGTVNKYKFLRITAIQVKSLTNVALP